MAVFELKTNRRAARPRSERLRELGGRIESGGNTVVNVGNGGNLSPNDHYHTNKADLDQISTDTEGYQYLTRLLHANDTDYEKVTEKVKAGFADLAKDLTEDSPIRKLFLSRLSDDVAKGNLTFEKMLVVLGLSVFKSGAHFGAFAKSLYSGTGAGIDERGNAEFESVRVRSYFECLELIINRLSAIEGDQILTEADTIERVVPLGGNRYGLYLKRKWEGYFTAQYPNNVLKGIVNTLTQGNNTYYTSWMRVNSVDTSKNYIEASLYADSETPAKKNYPPTEMMKIARWGNQTEPTRQSSIYLSSTEGRIVRLTGVTKPIIGPGNYGATFGSLPEWLKQLDLPIAEGQDYVYARGLIVQDIIRMDYQGNPIGDIVDRGAWRYGESYFANAKNPTTGIFEISDVWYNGCRYRCAKSGTKATPTQSGTDWALVGDFKGQKGEQGAPGQKGERGERGAQGAKGDKGEQGAPGAPGQKGERGERGAQGAKGDKGEQGAQGQKGDRGERGAQGAQGQKGDRGERGAQGAPGQKGDKGDEGDKGDRGAAIRGPQKWNDLPNGYNFQAGKPGEPFVDVVEYNGNYYLCKKPHSKTGSLYPSGSFALTNGYWQLGDKMEIVATKLLLAEGANIGDWYMQGGKIVSELGEDRARISLDAKKGEITAIGKRTPNPWRRAKTTVTPQGIEANTSLIKKTTEHRFHMHNRQKDNDDYLIETDVYASVAGSADAKDRRGVYATAFFGQAGAESSGYNGTNKAFGGVFEGLFAKGLCLPSKRLVAVGMNGGGIEYTITDEDCVLYVYPRNFSGTWCDIYLPTSARPGHTLFIMNFSTTVVGLWTVAQDRSCVIVPVYQDPNNIQIAAKACRNSNIPRGSMAIVQYADRYGIDDEDSSKGWFVSVIQLAAQNISGVYNY